MTLGNMRQRGVQRLVAYCLNDTFDVSSYSPGHGFSTALALAFR
jgi:hypothetical protein